MSSVSTPTPAGRWFAHPYVLLGLTSLFWGGNAVASRIAIGNVGPMALTMLRWTLACAVLAVIARDSLRADWPILRRRLPYLVFLGIFGLTAFNAMMYVAAYSTTAVNLTIIQGAIPVLVLLGALMAYRTPIRRSQVAGVLATIVGVAMVACKGDLATLKTLAFARGDLLMLVASACYAGYTVALFRRPQVSGLGFFTALAVVAWMMSIPLFVAELWSGNGLWPTPTGYLVIAYVALFPSLLAQIFFMRGVELIGPGRAGIFVNLVPVFGSILAVVILGEPFGWYHGVALMLVIGGIAWAQRR